MASIRESKGEGYLVLFRFGGRQFQRKLGTGDRKEAESRRKRIEATIHDLTTGRLKLPDPCPDVGLFILSDGNTAERTTATASKLPTVRVVVTAFLADAESRVADGTMSKGCLANYRKHLLPFAEKHGSRLAVSLTVKEAEGYARKPEWSASYRNGVLSSLVTAFRWASAGPQRLLPTNPLQGIRKPPKASRGARALVSAETHRQLVEHADPFFADFLQLLWLTGCRPSEVAGLTAPDVDLANGVAVLNIHKTLHQTGKPRIVFLCAEAIAILQRVIADRPAGLLFPGEQGEQMTANAVGLRLRRLCVRAGVEHSIPYGYRHSFATDALSKGVADAQVAALLGHTNTTMLHKHYSHLTAKAQALREAVGQIR